MKHLRVAIAILATATLAYAGDPWDDKKPSEWNEKEVMKILQGSPWGKRVATVEELVKDESKSTNTGRGQGSTGTFERGDLRPTAFATVMWWSARTPRRAYLRMAQLRGAQIDENQAREFTETEMPEHIIVIEDSGQMVATAAKLEEAELKQTAWLDLGKNQRVEPTEAGIISEGGKPVRIRFNFPRSVGNQPLMDGNRRVVFKWRLPTSPREKMEDAKLREVTFESKKMTIGSEADN